MTKVHTESNSKLKLQKYLDQAFTTLLILFPASLPYPRQICSVLIILLLATWLLRKGFQGISSKFRNIHFVLFIGLFFISVIGLIYSSNRSLSILEKGLSILIFPIIIFTSDIKNQTFYRALYFFVASCTLASLYALFFALRDPELLGTLMTFETIGISHVYFGLYISLSIVILSFALIKRKKIDLISAAIVFLILYLLLFSLYLGGKMSFISLVLLAFISSVFFLVKTKSWVAGVLLLVIPIATFYTAVTKVDIVKWRFETLIDPENYFIGDNAWNSIAVRVSILKCCKQNFEQSPIFGTGTGDIQNDLDTCYSNHNFTTIAEMNPHNQYIQFLLSNGLIGLFYFLVVLIYPAIKSYKEGNLLHLCFIFLFAFCCLTESFLQRQHGVMFYAFFNSLLFFQGSQSKDQKI